jgi:hypothetical protein
MEGVVEEARDLDGLISSRGIFYREAMSIWYPE